MEFMMSFCAIFLGMMLGMCCVVVIGISAWKLADYIKDKTDSVWGGAIALTTWMMFWLSIILALLKVFGPSSS